MIQKNYQKEIPSPFMGSRQYDVQRPDHPVQEEVRKFTGRYSIVAEVEQDKNTLSLMGIPGLVSFLTTLRDSSDGRILSQGRGSAVLNGNNRFISKMVGLAFGSSFVDASVRCAKVLDTLRPDRQNVSAGVERNNRPMMPSPHRYVESVRSDYRNSDQDDSFQPASQKQKDYLLHLLKSNDASEEEFAQVSGLSKDEAAEKIGLLVGSR